jgi:hypothetical protein
MLRIGCAAAISGKQNFAAIIQGRNARFGRRINPRQ